MSMNVHNISSARAHPTATWQRVFEKLDRKGPSLNIQIRRSIVYAIETGLLKSGDRLPSSRQLSNLLSIARNTVTAAYQMLIDEGVLVSRERSGIFVADRPVIMRRSVGERQPDSGWSARFAARPSDLRHFNKPRDWLSYPHPFLYGQFDPTIFPINNWREAVRVTSSHQEICGWAGDLIDDDDPDLVEQLCVHVLPKRGIFARPEEVIITIGSQQALSMLVQLLCGPKTKVGVEDPGYPDMRNMVQLATGDYTLLTMDKDGVVPDDVFAGCDMAYLTPGHQCPTTAIAPLTRRKALLDHGVAHDVILIEDDYEADLLLENSNELACLKSLDTTGQVIYVGSFSKALAPGLRIGFIVAHSAVVEELRVLRRLLMRHPPTNNQRILGTFISLGHYQQHLQKTGLVLARRAGLIAQLLPKYLPQCSWRRDAGAKSFWIRLPEGCNSRVLESLAREQGVLVEAGDIFFANQEDGARFMRLGFTSIVESHIETGLAIIGHLIDQSRTPS
ncbi:PLP-dependent aminotransferase family protein [Cohaesibacter sp. ES.047]|uniref:aminotransferase-like domain-containing protein n=1 Tax=Cohaesibacter sp. ES.047 TaxID=1798205 RepID=UPI000BB7DC0E|nr:PLP-dependent aminotransferase family protein [Cohaesibacter sp. ES.047]